MFNLPKDLPSFLKELSPSIAKEHGVPELAIKKTILASLTWFVASLSELEDPKAWMDKFHTDVKIEGLKIMMEDFSSQLDSEEGMKNIMEKLKNKFDDEDKD